MTFATFFPYTVVTTSHRIALPAHLLTLAGLLSTVITLPGETYWQLSLNYSEDESLTLVSADPMAPIQKTPRSPNENGAVHEIPCKSTGWTP